MKKGMFMYMRTAGIVLFIFLSAISGNAQAVPEHKMTVRVDLVRVDATVLDAEKRPIPNLSKDDFLIYENGRLQNVHIIADDTFPLSVALVIDRSQSTEDYFGSVKSVALDMLSRLSDRDEVMVIGFNERAEVILPFTDDKYRIAEALVGLRPGKGSTDLEVGIRKAVEALRISAPDRRRAIVLISDYEATSTLAAFDSRREGRLLQEMLKEDIAFSGIQTPGGTSQTYIEAGRGLVKRIAKATGGSSLDARSDTGAISALANELDKLKRAYVLFYRPKDARRNGKFRKITVRLRKAPHIPEKHFIQARKGYFAK